MIWHSKERLQHRLQNQALQLQKLLRPEYQVKVCGGTVHARWIHYQIDGSLAASAEKHNGLEKRLASGLQVPAVEIRHHKNGWRIGVLQPDPPPVSLPDMLIKMPQMPPLAAVLGLSDDRRPLLLDFQAPDVSNILIAGSGGAGKTTLLQSCLVSLAWHNRQSQLQLVLIDDPAARRHKKEHLRRLLYLPHLMTPVPDSIPEAAETIQFLIDEMRYRQRQNARRPMILLAVDNLDGLLEEGGSPILEGLITLLQEGPAQGIRLLLSLNQPLLPEARILLRINLPIRLVGQVESSEAARAASGIPDSYAEYLLGLGDFVAVTPGGLVHFQAAHLSSYDLHLILERINRRRPPAIVAHQTSPRPALSKPMLPAGPAVILQRSD